MKGLGAAAGKINRGVHSLNIGPVLAPIYHKYSSGPSSAAGSQALEFHSLIASKWISMKIKLLLAIFLLTLTAPLSSCSSQDLSQLAPEIMEKQGEVLQAQESHARRKELTLVAPVYKLLPDDTRGIPHERFLLRLANGSSVLVAHDTARAARVPVSPGDVVTIHGEYIWNDKGGVIHWTHHSDTPHHPGGWIILNGQKYE